MEPIERYRGSLSGLAIGDALGTTLEFKPPGSFSQAFDPIDQLKRYLKWYRTGYMSSMGTLFDIGNTTKHALMRFERTHEPYCGSTDPHTAGNGSIMRLAPVPLFYAMHPREAIELSGDSSRTTHGTKVAIDACRYLGEKEQVHSSILLYFDALNCQ